MKLKERANENSDENTSEDNNGKEVDDNDEDE